VGSGRQAGILVRLAAASAGGAVTTSQLCTVSAEVVEMTGAGITLISDGTVQVPAGSTDRVSSTIEDLQFTLGEGPCIDAHRQGVPVLEPDLAHPTVARWPAMCPAALAAGAAAIFGFPLRVDTARLGALDLYRDEPGPLSSTQHADALDVADFVAWAMLAMQAGAEPGELGPQLDAGTQFRYAVHQAAGMLSVQLDISVPEALDRLRAHAFTANRPAEDVAADIIARTLRLG
jgi:hypothetical protein